MWMIGVAGFLAMAGGGLFLAERTRATKRQLDLLVQDADTLRLRLLAGEDALPAVLGGAAHPAFVMTGLALRRGEGLQAAFSGQIDQLHGLPEEFKQLLRSLPEALLQPDAPSCAERLAAVCQALQQAAGRWEAANLPRMALSTRMGLLGGLALMVLLW